MLDLGTSVKYRKRGHIPGRLVGGSAVVSTKPGTAIGEVTTIVLTSTDGQLAKLAVPEARTHWPNAEVFALARGNKSWRHAGHAMEPGFERATTTADDVWYKPYDHDEPGRPSSNSTCRTTSPGKSPSSTKSNAIPPSTSPPSTSASATPLPRSRRGTVLASSPLGVRSPGARPSHRHRSRRHVLWSDHLPEARTITALNAVQAAASSASPSPDEGTETA